jgi:hypothetical protein
MPVARSEFSHFLHERRLVINQRWKEILSNAYLSRATLHRIRHGDPHHPIAEVDSLRSLANALQFKSWPDLVAAFEARDIRAGLPTDRYGNPRDESLAAPQPAPESGEDAVLSLSRALNVTPTELVRRLGVGTAPGLAGQGRPSLPRSLRMDEMRPARLVPHFTSGVAASRRVEKIEDEDHESKQPVGIEDARAFTIPVDGDCQDPVWKNGEIVVFSFDAYDREGILPGKSYYLAFTDGSTTFKRVFVDETDHEVYILRCWNTNKYPNERRVHFSEVVRVARAVSKQVSPEE